MALSAPALPLVVTPQSPARSAAPAAPAVSVTPVRPPSRPVWVSLPSHVSISTAPVMAPDYARFAAATLRPGPHQAAGRPGPAVYVSASDALAYAQWLAAGLRLPTAEELMELSQAAQADPLMDAFPKAGAPDGLSEWVCDPADNGLRRIVHRAWLLHPEGTHCQGALRDAGYSFITFRLVRDSR